MKSILTNKPHKRKVKGKGKRGRRGGKERKALYPTRQALFSPASNTPRTNFPQTRLFPCGALTAPNARQIFYGSEPDACYLKGTRSADRKAPARPCGRQPPVGAAPARRPRGNAKSKCDSIWTSSNQPTNQPIFMEKEIYFREIEWTKLKWADEDTKRMDQR